MTLDLQQVALAIKAVGEVPAIPVAGWSVDTRTQNAGDVYFALRGPNHDGRDYVANAWSKGAEAVVLDRPMEAYRGELVVPDTLRGLQDLGSWARRTWGGTVVGGTGS